MKPPTFAHQPRGGTRMKKVLIITYYWPPSGGAGVYRNLKFAKYFRQFGWEPVIFTPENADYPVLDESLAKDVPGDITIVRHPIREPYDFYRKLKGMKKGEKIYSGFMEEKGPGGKKTSFKQRLAVWVRGNFFIPDARMWWIRPSVRFLRKYLKEHPVDAILSSGPPHTTHMIARGVKRATGIPWIADFRDPWTHIDFYEQLNLSGWADRRHHKMERSVLKESDRVVTVSWAWAQDFLKLGAPKVDVITNGFDEDEFKGSAGQPHPGFTLTHLGSINADRSPEALWRAISELLQEQPRIADTFQVRLIGPADKKLVALLEELKLRQTVLILPYRPHAEAVMELMKSSSLLLLLNNTPNVMGVIPGKLFEYLAAKRPILAIGPANGDSARIIHETGTGEVCGFTEKDAIKKLLLKWHDEQMKGGLHLPEASHLAYSRRTLTGKMAHLLEEVTTQKPAPKE